jgi:predicted exporter
MSLDFRSNRKTTIGILIVIVGLCLLLLSGKKYSSDITDMLPEGSVAAKMLKYLHEENVAGRITVELRLNNDCSKTEMLPYAVTKLEKSLNHPEIISVFTGFAMPGGDELSDAYTALPQLVNNDDLAKIAEMTTVDEITKTMRRNYLQLVSPGGFEFYRFIEKDPLGLNRLVLKKLELFADIMTYRTASGSSMLIGPDYKRALLIIETRIPVSDSRRAKAFLSYLDGMFKQLPEEVVASVLCGHKHTIGNEKTIADDIFKVSIASLIIFALLFAVIYRRGTQSFLIILMPMFAVLFTVAIMSLLINHVSAFVIGLGGVMAGISVDYGICVYEICGKTTGKKFLEIRKIIRPLCAGALTTIGIFVAFLFSGTSAYMQLGIFAILSVTISLALAIYILPNLLSDKVNSPIIKLKTPVFKVQSAIFIVLAWCGIIGVSMTFALSSSFFDSSITSLDGAGGDIIKSEADFNAYWSKREMPAILVIKGKDREKVLEEAESLWAAASKSGINGFVSPIMLTPSTKTIRHNLNTWRNFWNDAKISKTLSSIASNGAKNGFRDDAFATFNSWLPASRNFSDNKCALVNNIQEKLLKRNGEDWTLTSFMIDSPENYKLIEKVQQQVPGLRVISPRVLRQSIGEDELNRLIGIGIASFLIVLLLSIIATGGFVNGIVALLPVVVAVTVICGFSAALHFPLTIPSCVAMIIIIGLSSDYGIFMVFRCFKSLQNEVMTSVALCALTTAAGALTLLFASHPVMFKLGITLFSGIIISYIAAVTLIPALAVLLKGKRIKIVQLSGILLIVTFYCSGCALYSTLPEPGPLLSSPLPVKYNPPDKRWSSIALLTFAVSGQQDSLLCAVEFDADNRKGSIVCMDPTGIKILETSFNGDRITHQFVIPQLQEHGIKVEDVIRDLKRISFDNKTVNVPGIVYEFDNNSGMLMTKKYVVDGSCLWKVSFRQYKSIGTYSVPYEVRLENSVPKYVLSIKIKEFTDMQ